MIGTENKMQLVILINVIVDCFCFELKKPYFNNIKRFNNKQHRDS